MADFTPTYRAELDNIAVEGKIALTPGAKPTSVEIAFNSFVGHKDTASGILGGYIHDLSGELDSMPIAYEIDLPEGFDENVRKGGQFRPQMAAAELEKIGLDINDIAKYRINLPAGTDDFEKIIKDRLALTHAERISGDIVIHSHGDASTALGGTVSEKGMGQFGHIDTHTGRMAQALDAAKGIGDYLPKGAATMAFGAVMGGAVLLNGGTMGEALAATGDPAALAVDAAEGNYWGMAQTGAEWAGSGIGGIVGGVAGSAVPFGGTIAGGVGGAVGGAAIGSEMIVEAASFGSGDFRGRLASLNIPAGAEAHYSQDFIDMLGQAKYIAHLEAQDFAGRDNNDVLPDFMSPEFTELQENLGKLEDAREGFENMYGQARIEGTLEGLHTQLAAAEHITAQGAAQAAEYDPDQVRSFSTSAKFEL